MEIDIRWLQRFANYYKALNKLTEGINYAKTNFIEIDEELDNDTHILDNIVKEGLIQRFEYTHELAWNVMKDYAEYQGNFEVKGSRDATQQAFKMKLINNGEVWMDMIKNRNRTYHTYNEQTANEIYRLIIEDYFKAFQDFYHTMEKLKSTQKGNLF